MSPSPSVHKRAEGWGVSVRKRTRTLLTTGLVLGWAMQRQNGRSNIWYNFSISTGT